MKWFEWIIITILALAILIYFYSKILIAKLSFEFGIAGVSLKSFNISDIIKIGQGSVKINSLVTINNKNPLGVTIRNLTTEIYYNNKPLAKSSDPIKKVTIKANSKNSFVLPLNVLLNTNSINLISQVKNNLKPTILYTIKFKVGFLPVTIKDSFVI